MCVFFSFSFRSIVNEGPNEFLSVRAPLYLAGVPEQTGTKAWKQWHLRNTTSFIGESYFLSFARKSKKFVKREIEVLNEFLNVHAHLYLAWGSDQTALEQN